MAIAYARGYVERAGTTADGPIRFIAANEGDVGDGIDLRMTGARLDRFRSNPVFGFGHRYHGRDNLPIGRAVRTEVEGPRLLIDVEFDQGDSFATEIERKYRAGFMNAVSIGFEVHEFEDTKGKGGGFHFGGVAIDWELLELSAGPIPADANAVVAAGGRDYSTDELEAAFTRALSKWRSTVAISEKVEPEGTELDPEFISAVAREALLTAITFN